jgi:hypothetical protein
MAKRRRYSLTHAATRFVQRSDEDPSITFTELVRRVKHMQGIEFIQRQTCSRSLVRTKGSGEYVYCIINRPQRSVITVLTKEQAAEQLKGDLREIPTVPINLH